MPELAITFADGRSIRHELDRKPVVVGRDADCDLPIDDPSASRHHARFSWSAAGYIVEDLASKNGTLVNDAPCTHEPLRDGDRILIGSTLAYFRDETDRSTERRSTLSVYISEEETATHATRYVSRDRQLLLSQQRLEMIYELSERLTTLQSRDQLLESALQICCDALKFERGAIGVRRPNERHLDWPVVHNLPGGEGELRISRTLLNRALEHGERAIFTEDSAGGGDPTVSMVQQGIRSAMCVPLLAGDSTLGVIYGDRTTSSTAYSDEDIDFLAGIARQVSIGLINCRLVEEQREMVRLKEEIKLARTIQTRLFPTALPNRSELKIAAINDPGQHVSGDYYDVIDAGDGRVWCLMADVTGEGVAAALLMANLQAAVRVTAHETDDPGKLLSRWNTLICRNTEASKFITCALALIDPKSHVIRVSLAGHCKPFIVRADGTPPTELDVDSGFPLGVIENAEYRTQEIEIGPSPFAYFCFTDGVTEAMSIEQEQFGKARLVERLGELTDLNPQSLVKHIRRAVSSFVEGATQSDDITILAARVG